MSRAYKSMWGEGIRITNSGKMCWSEKMVFDDVDVLSHLLEDGIMHAMGRYSETGWVQLCARGGRGAVIATHGDDIFRGSDVPVTCMHCLAVMP